MIRSTQGEKRRTNGRHSQLISRFTTTSDRRLEATGTVALNLESCCNLLVAIVPALVLYENLCTMVVAQTGHRLTTQT